MLFTTKIKQAYTSIKQDCAITTAVSEKFAPHLLNMLASLKTNFPNHPKVYIFDLGISKCYLKELKSISWVVIEDCPRFAKHWRYCYSWKPYLWARPEEKYILHLDSGCVILKSLETLFLSIKKNGYLAFSQNQKLKEIIYQEMWDEVGLINNDKSQNEEVFAAGIFGFDLSGFASLAIKEACRLSHMGLLLGFSLSEKFRMSNPSEFIIRDCLCFRHDQSAINLTLRKYAIGPILIKSNSKFIPHLHRSKHKGSPFIYHCRLNFTNDSMTFFWVFIDSLSFIFLYNRIIFYALNAHSKFRNFLYVTKRKFN